MDGLRHYEDFAAGAVFPLGSRAVSREEIVAFAEEFDPQPFHLDEEAARASLLGGLSASGWHTAAIMMRLYVDGLLNGSAAMGGAGIDRLDWRLPVRPGDRLTGRATVLDRRISQRRPGMGIVRFEIVLENDRGETVLVCVTPVLFGVRGS
jgi:acyl dehydratase